MDKCFACSNNAEYMLPCYHKICSICLHDLSSDITADNELVCLCYPNDKSDKQCLTKFTNDDVILLPTSGIQTAEPIVEVCPKHNKMPYTYICESTDYMYCIKCDHHCQSDYHTIKEWKSVTLDKMNNLMFGLNTKIKGLTCLIELINNNNELTSIVKQFEDIIDTILVDISHIDNFNQIINDDNIPISNIIKRKKILFNYYDNINIPKEIPSLSTDSQLIEIINAILHNNADNEKTLRWASRNGKLAVVEYLLKNKTNIHTWTDEALRDASQNGHLDVVECLINNGADIYACEDQAFRMACYYGNLDVVEFLISKGAYIHSCDDQPLKYACMHGHTDIVKCLIKNYDHNACDEHIIHNARIDGYTDIVECLTKHNESVGVLNHISATNCRRT
jgi:ankyrin repeat protein